MFQSGFTVRFFGRGVGFRGFQVPSHTTSQAANTEAHVRREHNTLEIRKNEDCLNPKFKIPNPGPDGAHFWPRRGRS